MECPNCGFKVSDTARCCLHCGTMFQHNVNVQTGVDNVLVNTNSAVVQPNNFQPNVANQPMVNSTQPNSVGNNNVQFQSTSNTNKEDETKKYYKAYFGSSYDSVMTSGFSFGTFFLGIVWLLVYKLFSNALGLFLTILVIEVVAFVLTFVSLFIGIPIGIFGFIAFIANIIVTFNYAKSFPSDRLAKANNDIGKILNSTNDEAERLRLCAKAGKPIYWFLLLDVLPVGTIILSIIASISSTIHTIDNSRKEYIIDNSKQHINIVRNYILAQEIIPSDGKEYVNDKYYYALIDSEKEGKQYINYEHMPEGKGIVLYRRTSKGSEYYICFADSKYMISSNGFPLREDSLRRIGAEKGGNCNINETIEKYDAQQLIMKE